jgi:sulfite reductase (NADPH) flavoprotein alpha-component
MLADRAVKEGEKRGFQAVMKNMSDIAPADLAKIPNLLVIVSTWGDGDPPETAVAFYKEFMETAPSLEKLRFSVCALGDTSYEKFCQTGKDIDARLEALGANAWRAGRIATWITRTPSPRGSTRSLLALAPASAVPAVVYVAAPAAPAPFGKKKPVSRRVARDRAAEWSGLVKETLHLEFSSPAPV